MPWATPNLRQTRELVRGEVTSALTKASFVGNSVLRIISDAQAALAHLVLRYIDWLARQLLPDTAEGEWLERHGAIWLKNADGSLGRKGATGASGSGLVTGVQGTIVPIYSALTTPSGEYETIAEITIGTGPTSVPISSVTVGSFANMLPGDVMTFVDNIPNVDPEVIVETMEGGTDVESIPLLRERVLERIRKPPMGGDADDYVAWAKAVAGVTRAWAAPNEMGIGTVTVRIMMDDLRSTNDPMTDGFPDPDDLTLVWNYLDTVRPVAIKDFWVEAPIPEPIDFTIQNLSPDGTAIRAAIYESVKAMLDEKARPAYAVDGVLYPAQTIYREWVSAAILYSEGVESFDLIMDDHVMPSNGRMAVMGTITYI